MALPSGVLLLAAILAKWGQCSRALTQRAVEIAPRMHDPRYEEGRSCHAVEDDMLPCQVRAIARPEIIHGAASMRVVQQEEYASLQRGHVLDLLLLAPAFQAVLRDVTQVPSRLAGD